MFLSKRLAVTDLTTRIIKVGPCVPYLALKTGNALVMHGQTKYCTRGTTFIMHDVRSVIASRFEKKKTFY